MRKLKTLLLAALLVLGISVMLPTKAQAETKATFTYTDNSVTVSWPAPPLNNSSSYTYTVDSYAIYDYHTKQYVASGISPNTRSYTVTGLSTGYISWWQIQYTYHITYSNGDTYTPTYPGSVTYVYVNTSIPKYGSSNFAISYVYKKQIQFAASKYTDSYYNNNTGYQIQLFKGSKCVKTVSAGSTYTSYVTISSDKVYKYRVRGYYSNPDTQQTIYGPWSAYKYFDLPTVKYSTKYGVRGSKLTIKKVSGVSKYNVYVSTNSSSGFKKTMTVTIPSSAKKKTVSLTKIGSKALKKGNTYYVRVIPVIKAGSKTVQSDTLSKFSFYNWK